MALTPATESSPTGRRQGHPFLTWSLAAFVATVVVVLVTGIGVDILLIAALLAGLFVVERFIGDWFVDVLGPGLGPLLLVGLLVGLAAWGMSGLAPKPVRNFVSNPLGSVMQRAEGYGYTGAFVTGNERPVLSPVGGPGVGPSAEPPTGASGSGGRAGLSRFTGRGTASAASSAIARSESERPTATVPIEPTVGLTVEPSKPRAGDAARIVVTLSSDQGPVGGEVAVDINRVEAGRLMSSDGTAAWTTTFPKGRFRLRARYLGAGRFTASRSAPVVVDVEGL